MLEVLPADALVEARLETGRTHQVRAHFAAIGHPIAGDQRYGHAGRHNLERQFLHSARLRFDHPFTGEALAFDSELPEDLAALERARGGLSPVRSGARVGAQVGGRVIGAPAPVAQSTRAPYNHARPVTDPSTVGRGPARHGSMPGPREARGAQDEQGSIRCPSPGSRTYCRQASISATRHAAGIRALRRYIHGERDRIHIIDLLQTERLAGGGAALRRGDRRQGRLDSLRRHEEA